MKRLADLKTEMIGKVFTDGEIESIMIEEGYIPFDCDLGDGVIAVFTDSNLTVISEMESSQSLQIVKDLYTSKASETPMEISRSLTSQAITTSITATRQKSSRSTLMRILRRFLITSRKEGSGITGWLVG